VATNDHLMDAARYVTIGTMNVLIRDPKLAPISQRRPEIDSFNPQKRSKRSGSWDSY
jgi:hypothetical protein